MSIERTCSLCGRQRSLAQIRIRQEQFVCRDTLDCLEHMTDDDLIRVWNETSGPNIDIEARLHRLMKRLRSARGVA